MTAERRLHEAGLHLPAPVQTRFRYQPALVDRGTIYLGGQLPKLAGDVVEAVGVLGRDVSLERAAAAATLCALQAIAWMRHELGTLERVRRILRLGAYVRVGTEGSDAMSSVIDTASSVLEIAFGDAGRHARSVLGVADLPRHSVVMIDLVAAVTD